MTLELKLVEAFVIERAELGCQATKCTHKPELRGDAVHDENEPDVRRELETRLSFTLRLSQRVSSRKKIGVQDVATVCGVREIADPVRGVETATLELSRCLDVSRPRNDKSPKIVIGAGLIATQSTLLYQIVTKLSKPESGLIVSETRSREYAQPYIGVARAVAIAVLQAEANHSANHERQQFGIEKQCGRHDLCENIQNVEHVGICHQRQVDEFLDLPVFQQGPDLVVFSQYFRFGRVRGPIRAATFPVFKKDLHGAIAAIHSCVEREAQPCHESDFVGGLRTFGQHGKLILRSAHIRAQQFALGQETFNREDKIVVTSPSFVCQQCPCRVEIRQR